MARQPPKDTIQSSDASNTASSLAKEPGPISHIIDNPHGFLGGMLVWIESSMRPTRYTSRKILKEAVLWFLTAACAIVGLVASITRTWATTNVL